MNKTLLLAGVVVLGLFSSASAYENEKGDAIGWIKTSTVNCHAPREGSRAAFTYIDVIPCNFLTKDMITVYDKPGGKAIKYLDPNASEGEDKDELILFEGKKHKGYTFVYLPKDFHPETGGNGLFPLSCFPNGPKGEIARKCVE